MCYAAARSREHKRRAYSKDKREHNRCPPFAVRFAIGIRKLELNARTHDQFSDQEFRMSASGCDRFVVSVRLIVERLPCDHRTDPAAGTAAGSSR